MFWLSKDELKRKIQPALDILSRNGIGQLEIVIQTGSGQSVAFNHLKPRIELAYEKIPSFPIPRAQGHEGLLKVFSYRGRNFAYLAGRAHFYEGYEGWELGIPIRVFKELGAKDLVLVNASGSLTNEFQIGDFVLVEDFIEMCPSFALRGLEGKNLAVEFLPMTGVLNERLAEILYSAAKKKMISLKKGIYAMTAGPRYETPAEINALKKLGANIVGMSTLPELITALSLGMRTIVISTVSNLAFEKPANHLEVLKASKEVSEKLSSLLEGFIFEYFATEAGHG